jgi:RNA polymerase sigma-70 factor, ECF subfamily
MTEQELVAAARGGAEDAFGLLVEPHCPALRAHCYRMLGSLQDADDALQDALLRAWRGLSRFDGRSSLRRWLYRITTNACLDELARRSRRVLPIDYGARGDFDADDGLLLGLESGCAAPESRCEQREVLELAVAAALHLPARQRAALVLREVLGFSAQEVSESLGTTVASVNSALQRARTAVDQQRRETSQQATMRSLGDARVRETVEGFVDAFERGDVNAIV